MELEDLRQLGDFLQNAHNAHVRPISQFCICWNEENPLFWPENLHRGNGIHYFFNKRWKCSSSVVYKNKSCFPCLISPIWSMAALASSSSSSQPSISSVALSFRVSRYCQNDAVRKCLFYQILACFQRIAVFIPLRTVMEVCMMSMRSCPVIYYPIFF